MALIKLSVAIKKEYEAPYPDRRTALAHFQKLYHVEKRGGWYVDMTIRKIKPVATTGNADADSILKEIVLHGR